jgi:hypothetical protein
MLPDLPAIKLKLRQTHENFVNDVYRKFMKESLPVPPRNLWEGNSMTIHRNEDESDKNSFVSITGTGKAQPDKDTLETVFANLVDMARDVSTQMTEAGLKILDDKLTAHGHVISAVGKFEPSHIFETFEKVEFGVNKYGQLDLSGFGMIADNKVKVAFFQTLNHVWQNDEHRSKLLEILMRKQEKINEREINRKLVR